MRVLLDTHSFLWFMNGDEKLSSTARFILDDIENEVLLSIASLWEIAIKTSLGKLSLERRFEDLIPQQLVSNEIDVLPIGLKHLAVLTDLPFQHRDPFDRLIIAQAMSEGLPILSRDQTFREYPVQVIW